MADRLRRIGRRREVPSILIRLDRLYELGRHSYLTCDPFGAYIVADGQASWNGQTLDDAWEVLRTLLARYPQRHRPDLPPSQGGAAGFFAYDLNRTLEQLPPAIAGQPLPQSVLHFFVP
ncbi:hypothetical protein [Bradyrhizobium niftali]|uniref:hypothetical protein n=1 Tax=Bradyrhizobium niftali TaxID=2560055 RepID=UPI001F3B9637|nr:hypothetical protein [Bradyrhizobium niftali]